MIGDEASHHRTSLQITYPMENGIIRNWEEMIHLWDYTFKTKLSITDFSDYYIMLTEPAMNPKKKS
jgi:actin-related protein 2